METIILDVDGVLRDIVSTTLKIYKREFDMTCEAEYKDVRTYDMTDAMPYIGNLSKFYQDEHFAREVFFTSQPYEKNIGSLVSKLHKNYNIHIATNQLPDNEDYTLEWLKLHKIPYDAITFTQNKETVNGDYLIDDYPKNLIDAVKAGIIPVIYDQPYNKHYRGLRINTLKDFIEEKWRP